MVLYHASQTKNLRLVKPRRTLSHNKYIGDYVFASMNKKMALMYLVPKGIPTLMNPDGDNLSIVIGAQEAEVMKLDKGGAIYELPADTFTESPQHELGEYEMVSKEAVTPVRETDYESAIAGLTSARITIRFTDKETFQNLIWNPNQRSMIEKIEVYQPSV